MRRWLGGLAVAGFLLTVPYLAAQTAAPDKSAPTIVVQPYLANPYVPKDPATEDQIREYLSLVGVSKTAHEVMDKMVDTMQATGAPYYPKAFWEDMREEFRKFDLITPYATVYQRYMSREDMQAVIDFYRSPSGKKLLAAQPLAIRDVQIMMRETAERLGQQVYARHAAEIAAAKAKYDADAAANAAKKK